MKLSLVEFSIENYKIFKERVTFSMVVERISPRNRAFRVGEGGGVSLMKTAMIYGANASGKTTLLDAIKTLDLLIRKSEIRSIEYTLPYDPYIFVHNNTSPTVFETVFLLDKKEYKYFISFNKESVYEEYLEDDKGELFRREGKNLKHDQKRFSLPQDFRDHLKHNVLVLTKAATSSQNETANNVVTAFKENLNIISEGSIGYSADMILQNNEIKNQFMKHLGAADFSITGIDVTEEDIPKEIREKFNLPEHFQKTPKVTTLHSILNDKGLVVSEGKLSLGDESQGTQAYFGLLGPILDTIANGKVLFIDEFDNSLHPLLTKYIIDLFDNEETNPHNAQLIVTTHDVSLLHYKDEFTKYHFWFTDKGECGSTLYSLAEFVDGERDDKKRMETYLQGAFGAIPLI